MDDESSREAMTSSIVNRATSHSVVANLIVGGNNNDIIPNPMSFCSVCKEVSDNHHLHYGALCCFSCRAFFRRANQIVGKVYACKQDGKCDVSRKNRKKCQKCRYEACLRVGMDPALVLTEDQKKARFRKMLEKKSDDVSGSGSGSESQQTPNPQAQRRPSYQTQRSEGRISASGSKIKRHDAFGSIKRRRTTPPNWTGITGLQMGDDYGNDQDDDQEENEMITNEEEAQGNLDNLERLLSLGDLQTDTLQEVEATLNVIQSTKRFSEMPYNYHQIQQQQQQQQQHQQHYQLQQRVGTAAFYSVQKPLYQMQQQQTDFYASHLARPIQPVCLIKQEANDDCQPPSHPTLHQLGSSSLYTDSFDNNSTDSFIENLQSYFDSNSVTSKIDDIDKPSCNIDPLRRIMSDFERAVSTSLAQESDLVQTLLSFHCNGGRVSKYDARRLITCLAETFRQFAASQPAFQSISGADQFRLLAVTRPLFVHYILGQYFTNATDGSTQLRWLLGDENVTGLNMSGAASKSICEFNDEVGLFLTQSSAERYLRTALEGLSGLKVSPCHNGLVAALLLFSPKPSSHNVIESFDHPATVQANESVLLKMLAQSQYGTMLGITRLCDMDDIIYTVPFVDTLHVLRNIFMEQVITEDEKRCTPINNHFPSTTVSPPVTPSKHASTPSTPKKFAAPITPTNTVPFATATAKKSSAPATATKSSPWLSEDTADIEVTFTPDEESWINKQLVKFQSTFREVSLGDEFVKEFVMFSYDVPLSKHFATRAYSTFAERFKKILEVHPGFSQLSEMEQNAIWRGGCAKAAACCSAKAACCPTGNDQLEFLFGDADRRQWRENFTSSVSGSKVAKIKKIQMADCNRVSAILTSEEMIDYLRLVGALGEVTSDEEIFKMLVLLSLFSGDDLPESVSSFVSNIRNGYIKMLRRKLRHDRRTFSKIVVSLHDIDKLARIMKKLELQENNLRHEN